LHEANKAAPLNTASLISTNSLWTISYGYVEAICQQAAGPDFWPAWWLDGQSWPADWEINVLEDDGGNDGAYHCHNPAGGPGASVSVPGATTGFHSYAAHITPASVSFSLFFLWLNSFEIG